MCFATAYVISQEYGLDLVLGYAAPEVDRRPRVHCFNLDRDGLIVDAAWQRGASLGYLGYRPSELEIAVLARASAPGIESIAAARPTRAALPN